MDHRVVLVMSRSRAGEWTMWRVGRHRLAWRPARQPGTHPYRWEYRLDNRDDQLLEMLSWLGAVLATIVVLPWRLVTNRWPVVAYVVVPMDLPGRPRRTRPMPRAEADELVRRWAADIEQHGAPPPEE